MTTATYAKYRGNLETYFDRTASKAWEQLTSDAPVSGIRATVRAGRTEMRDTLLSWLPAVGDPLTVAAGVDIARTRAPAELAIDWRVGDMLDPALGQFDHVVAMDSLIHYKASDIVGVLQQLAGSTRGSIAFTFAPATPLLMALLGMGRLFPRSDRSPAILPVRHRLLRTMIEEALPTATIGRDRRISASFYTSHALEVMPG